MPLKPHEVFDRFYKELESDLKTKGIFWSPTLASDSLELRTVIIRGLVKKKSGFANIIIHTDKRSQKWKQFQENPQAGLHFYCPQRRWQIRMKGCINLIEEGDFFQGEWSFLSEKSKILYGLKETPGSSCKSAEEAFSFSQGNGLKNFGVLIFGPTYMESLQLSDGPFHRRVMWDSMSNRSSFLVP